MSINVDKSKSHLSNINKRFPSDPEPVKPNIKKKKGPKKEETQSSLTGITAEYHIDVEHVLRDVMYIIVKYADYDTLSNIAEVCMVLEFSDKLSNITAVSFSRSWREEALREKAKRLCIQQLRLPYKFGNLDRMLDLKPCVSLLFYGMKKVYPQPIELTPVEKLLKNSMKEIPHTAIMLRADVLLTSEDSAFHINKDTAGDERDVLGLFLSNFEGRVHLQHVCLSDIPDMKEPSGEVTRHAEVISDDLVAMLGLNDCEDPKSFILLFESFTALGLSVTCNLFTRFHKKVNFMTFGIGKIMSANFQNPSQEDGKEEYCMVAMKISGPNVECWSASIDIDLPVDHLERKLEELKEKIKPRKHTTGLLYARPCLPEDSQCNSHSKHPAADCPRLMRILKRIFPSIPFVGIFRERGIWDPQMIRESRQGYPILRILEELSIVIISYD